MLEEQWKSIEGFGGAYEVSDHGRVRSVTKRGVKIRKLSERVFQGRKFLCVVLTRETAKKRCLFIHRLVAEAFLSLPSGLPTGSLIVRHKDGNRLNNLKGNLEWGVKSRGAVSWKLVTEDGTTEIITGLDGVADKLDLTKISTSHLVLLSKKFPNMLPRIERC